MEILELKNRITKILISVEELNSRIERTEERIRELDDRTIEMIQSEQQKENWLEKNEQSLRDLWDCNKRSGIHAIRVPEREDKVWGWKVFEEIIAENFSNLAKDINLEFQETEQTPKG